MVSDALVEAVWGGGYPEALARTAPRRRTAWARQYLQALVQRDVRDVANIDRLDPLPRLLRALAQIAGQMCNYNPGSGKHPASHSGLFAVSLAKNLVKERFFIQPAFP